MAIPDTPHALIEGSSEATLTILHEGYDALTSRDQRLVRLVHAELLKGELSDSAFGRQALNDWKLIRQLRAGRRLWPDTEGRVRTFMAGYRPKARAEAGQ